MSYENDFDSDEFDLGELDLSCDRSSAAGAEIAARNRAAAAKPPSPAPRAPASRQQSSPNAPLRSPAGSPPSVASSRRRSPSPPRSLDRRRDRAGSPPEPREGAREVASEPKGPQFSITSVKSEVFARRAAAAVESARGGAGGGAVARVPPRATRPKAMSAAPMRSSANRRPAGQPAPSAVTVSLLEAHARQVSDLENRLAEQRASLVRLEEENKLLRKVQRQTERGLTDMERQTGELPRVLASYNEEIRLYKEKARAARESADRLEHELRAKDERLNKYIDRCEKLMTILKAKDLDAKHTLAKELELAHAETKARDATIADLERHVTALQSTKDYNDKMYRQKLKTAFTDLQAAKVALDAATAESKGDKARVQMLENLRHELGSPRRAAAAQPLVVAPPAAATAAAATGAAAGAVASMPVPVPTPTRLAEPAASYKSPPGAAGVTPMHPFTSSPTARAADAVRSGGASPVPPAGGVAPPRVPTLSFAPPTFAAPTFAPPAGGSQGARNTPRGVLEPSSARSREPERAHEIALAAAPAAVPTAAPAAAPAAVPAAAPAAAPAVAPAAAHPSVPAHPSPVEMPTPTPTFTPMPMPMPASSTSAPLPTPSSAPVPTSASGVEGGFSLAAMLKFRPPTAAGTPPAAAAPSGAHATSSSIASPRGAAFAAPGPGRPAASTPSVAAPHPLLPLTVAAESHDFQVETVPMDVDAVPGTPAVSGLAQSSAGAVGGSSDLLKGFSFAAPGASASAARPPTSGADHGSVILALPSVGGGGGGGGGGGVGLHGSGHAGLASSTVPMNVDEPARGPLASHLSRQPSGGISAGRVPSGGSAPVPVARFDYVSETVTPLPSTAAPIRALPSWLDTPPSKARETTLDLGSLPPRAGRTGVFGESAATTSGFAPASAMSGFAPTPATGSGLFGGGGASRDPFGPPSSLGASVFGPSAGSSSVSGFGTPSGGAVTGAYVPSQAGRRRPDW